MDVECEIRIDFKKHHVKPETGCENNKEERERRKVRFSASTLANGYLQNWNYVTGICCFSFVKRRIF